MEWICEGIWILICIFCGLLGYGICSIVHDLDSIDSNK